MADIMTDSQVSSSCLLVAAGKQVVLEEVHDVFAAVQVAAGFWLQANLNTTARLFFELP